MPARFVVAAAVALVIGCTLAACTPEPKLSVAVSIGRTVTRPVLSAFSHKTGTSIDFQRIEPGEALPDEFDVLWSSDPAVTIQLAKTGQLAHLPADVLTRREARYVDSGGTWIAVTADVRVIVYDPKRIEEDDTPTHFEDLLDPRWATRVALARPIHLSPAWHAATLFAAKGAAPAAAFFRDLESAGATFVDDDRDVLKAVTGDGSPIGVLSGEIAFASRDLGNSLGILIPDQDVDGAVLMPTTLAIHRRAAESARARQLVQYLTSPPVSRRLALMSSRIALTRAGVTGVPTLSIADLKVARPTVEETVAQLNPVRRALVNPG